MVGGRDETEREAEEDTDDGRPGFGLDTVCPSVHAVDFFLHASRILGKVSKYLPWVSLYRSSKEYWWV